MSQQRMGRLVVVVGPSGSGKDTLLSLAQQHFASHRKVRFVRRVITRPCDPKSEVHDSETEERFLARQQGGEFSIWWRANGYCYGLPSSIHQDIDDGCLLVANGSRAAIANFRETFPSLSIVSITVSANTLSARLRQRARETDTAIEKRLERNSQIGELQGDDIISIDNSGDIDEAASAFIAVLESYL